jgi:hypothetical protein
MLAPWVMAETKTVKLHDQRLDARPRTVLAQLADRPTASIPAACGGHAEMTAAYRLFDNEKAAFDNTLEARESHPAEVSVRAARVALRPPYRPAGKLPAVMLNVVLVHEAHPPAGEEPVEWLLLTSLPNSDLEQVQVIQYYCTRWIIEVFFRVLKSGFRVEERRFEALDRLLTCLARYLIVAWRSLYVCRLGRSCPAINCETVFEPAEWKAIWEVVRRMDPPADPPRLDEMIRLVAQRGRYVNRTGAAPLVRKLSG